MQAKDPVCGMMVDVGAAAANASYQEVTYYFCSVECRDRFRAEPGRYVDRERHEPPYTSDAITAPKFGSAGSGGLEHEMPPEMHDRH